MSLIGLTAFLPQDFLALIYFLSESDTVLASLSDHDNVYLIESGLLRLQRNPTEQSLHELHVKRLNRLLKLSNFVSHFGIIHLSDRRFRYYPGIT